MKCAESGTTTGWTWFDLTTGSFSFLLLLLLVGDIKFNVVLNVHSGLFFGGGRLLLNFF